MKFSYEKLKELVPGIPEIDIVAEKITAHLFEVESREDGMIDLKILPNRYSDAACYWGIAREIAAMCDLPFKEPESKKPKAETKGSVAIEVTVPSLCRRIMACPVSGVTIGPSPAWLREILSKHGVNAISNIVDITNFVTLETGQPLHAFDMDKVQGGKLMVRQARDGEIVETLDGKSITLNPSALVIADTEHALDIAGIKGGARAEIGEKTQNILLTAANFDGAITYKTARRVGIATDASARFSHHLSPELAERGLYRALELIREICGGTPGKTTDEYPKPEKEEPIKFGAKEFAEIAGQEIAETECARTMKKLGFKVQGTSVTRPRWRTDITTARDCAEEVIRLLGYAAIGETAPKIAPGSSGTREEVLFTDMLADAACACGLTEIKTGSCAKEGEIRLENPVNEELPFLRPSLVPEMALAIDRNLRQENDTALFEIGRVFTKKASHEPAEGSRIALGVAARGESKEAAFRRARGIAEAIMGAAGVVPDAEIEEGTVLKIMCGKETIGTYSYDASQGVGFAELDIDKMLAVRKTERKFEPLPKFPKSSRDVSLIVAQHEKVGKMMEMLRSRLPEHGENVSLVGIYEGKGISEGKKSVTLRIVFGAKDRTLEDAEIDNGMKTAIEAMHDAISFEIR